MMLNEVHNHSSSKVCFETRKPLKPASILNPRQTARMRRSPNSALRIQAPDSPRSFGLAELTRQPFLSLQLSSTNRRTTKTALRSPGMFGQPPLKVPCCEVE
jgi:hypothetical protein